MRMLTVLSCGSGPSPAARHPSNFRITPVRQRGCSALRHVVGHEPGQESFRQYWVPVAEVQTGDRLEISRCLLSSLLCLRRSGSKVVALLVGEVVIAKLEPAHPGPGGRGRRARGSRRAGSRMPDRSVSCSSPGFWPPVSAGGSDKPLR